MGAICYNVKRRPFITSVSDEHRSKFVKRKEAKRLRRKWKCTENMPGGLEV